VRPNTGPASYKKYLLGLLLVIQTFSYIDGTALGLVLQNIKASLDLTDSELGLLSGIAFAAFYSIMGLPLARWADRGNRVLIISLCAAAWSIMVALSGAAAGFLQLLLIRMGVAVGESGCVPPANSLIADHFSRAERPRAVSIYMLGPSLGMMTGYLFAGWLNEAFGWRVMFIVLGLPGLIPAAVAWLTLRDPRTRKQEFKAVQPTQTTPEPALVTHAPAPTAPDLAAPENPSAGAGAPGMTEVGITLWRNATFRHLLLFFSAAYFFGYGILQWQPAFFVRSYGLSTGELGVWFAVIYGAGGLLGTYAGGRWASRYAPNNERLQLKTAALLYAAFGLVSALVYVSPNPYVAFALMALAAFGSAATIGPVFATIQTLVPARMRAVSIALIYLIANLIGLGLGPLVTGALSDTFRPVVGEESLRYALLTLCPGYLWVAWHLLQASKTVTRDLESAQSNADIPTSTSQDIPPSHATGPMDSPA